MIFSFFSFSRCPRKIVKPWNNPDFATKILYSGDRFLDDFSIAKLEAIRHHIHGFFVGLTFLSLLYGKISVELERSRQISFLAL